MKYPDHDRLYEGRGKYRHRRPPEYHARHWLIGGKQGICLVSGPASGQGEALNFDDHDANLGDTVGRWRAEVRRAAPGLHKRLHDVQTPGDGKRVLYRNRTSFSLARFPAAIGRHECRAGPRQARDGDDGTRGSLELLSARCRQSFLRSPTSIRTSNVFS